MRYSKIGNNTKGFSQIKTNFGTQLIAVLGLGKVSHSTKGQYQANKVESSKATFLQLVSGLLQ